MRDIKPWIMAAAMIAVTGMLPAAAQNGMAASDGGKIGPSGVWQAPQDFLTKAHTVCDKSANPASFGECFINQMSPAGAPAEAVSFTRMLNQQPEGMVGIMAMFKKYGTVDAAQVLYPLRANDNYALLLVNGDPKILDVDDLQKLDQAAMQQDPLFQSVKKQFPNVTLFPGDRSGDQPWPRMQPLAGGGQEFTVTYPLLDGCHACKRLGLVRFAWDFDASGKFLKTVYIPTPPPPKLLKRPRGQNPAQQQQPQATPPAQPSPQQ